MADTYRPPKGVQDEAKMALAWIADGKAGQGFTNTGRKRASDLAAGHSLSAETVLRMYSFLKRHQVDSKATGFNAGEEGFPSPGRVAWSAWGGDPGLSWSSKIHDQLAERSAFMKEDNSMNDADSPKVFGSNAYGVANSVMAVDASIDAAQTLLEQIKDANPIAAQAYYLLVAADNALDPVIDALNLDDPDEDETEEENAAVKPEDYAPSEDADAATKMLDDEDDSEDAWIAHNGRSATGSTDLPIAARDKAWSAAAADKRVQKYAGGKDAMDWEKYGKAFFYCDESDKEKLGSYKLQFADVVDGELVAVPRAIFAVAAVLNGARGGVDIPEADKEAIKDKVTAYYEKMAEKFSDEEIKAPFEGRAASARIGEGTYVSWSTSNGRARGRVEKVTSRGTASSSDGYAMEATDDNPVFHVRIYHEQGNGWVATDTVTVHRSNYLTIIKPLPSPRKADLPMIEERKTMIRTAEKITMEAELRAVGQIDENFKIAGYAATFNQEATGLNFREMIAPGAFSRSLSTDNPVFLLVNHDTDQLPLASTQSGTLRLSEDDHGLRMEADLDMKNPRAAELASAIERGDVNKMSFAFSVGPDGQTKEDGLRTLTDLDLYEVSAVTWPAYNSTTLGARSAEEIEDLELAKRKLALKFNQYSLRQKRKA